MAGYHKDLAIVFFEAPHRIARTLQDLQNYVKQPILVFRELTKLYEECLQGAPADIGLKLEHPQGEFTIVIPRLQGANEKRPCISDDILRHEVGLLTETSLGSKRQAARLVARKFGLSTKFVYEAVKD
jgi:16S rRNA C1402 (ribose-2'-O) methylase RsmI